VRACPELSSARASLWLKNDGLSHPVYGGNKVRKVVPLIREAQRQNAQRVLSFGAAGSHHLLTLTLFARAAGLESAAVLIPQPFSQHAEDTLRAAIGLGLEPYPSPHSGLVPWTFARALRRFDYVIPPGGSSVLGASACADAVDELGLQIDDGALPTPDFIVVPLGSGGTCGGLAAGLIRRGLPSRVLGVQVVPGRLPRIAARALALAVLGRMGRAMLAAALSRQLIFDSTQIGAGYGRATAESEHATRAARTIGLELEPTYTAKAFASVLQLLDAPERFGRVLADRPLRILYWHTLSAIDLGPLLCAAPSSNALPADVARLLV
jgi:1-aminocyclopropane-1-carboxylate deaminase/D-cysteine desulfhydrase-like pyridoxal-dependent ACC family enzyme